jgi:hypothetical protein
MAGLLGDLAVGDDLARMQRPEHGEHVVVERHGVILAGPRGSAWCMSDAPDADVQEQHQEVRPGERIEAPASGPDVPEADALEQAIEVEEDEERDGS